jgi:hypothetical protein
MKDRNQPQDDMNSQDGTALDRELDAALAKFAAVEPRAGLEERVLANLRAERERSVVRAWWRWPAAVALAAMILVAISIAWRTQKSVQNVSTQHRPAPMQPEKQVGTQLANNDGSGSIRPHDAGSEKRLKPHAISSPATAIAPAPKLDQFPSPQPLTEQEKMLADYVTQHHQQAILVARARMAELKQDLAEMEAPSNHPPSDQFVNQQEEK